MTALDIVANPARRPRNRRGKHKSRIMRSLQSALATQKAIKPLGHDHFFAALLSQYSKTPPTMAAMQVLFGNFALTLVGVPDRIWSNEAMRALVIRVKEHMERMGRPCVLLPESAIGTVRLTDIASLPTS